MAIENVAQNEQASFADPQNGTSPIDADEVTANDNALRAKHNTHDADATIHVQGSLLADRPAAGVAGRKWMTRDTGGVVRLFRDSGSAWEEVSYLPSGTDSTISGVLTFATAPIFSEAQAFADNVTVAGTLDVTGVATFDGGAAVDGLTVTSGATITGNSTVTGTLGGLTGLTVASGGATIAGNSTITGTLGGVTTMTATTFAGSGASLTSLPAAQLTGTIAEARLPGTITTLTVTNLTATNPITGSVASATTASSLAVGGASLKVDAAETTFLNTGGAASYAGTTAPGGNGTSQWLNVTVGGVACRIECKTVA